MSTGKTPDEVRITPFADVERNIAFEGGDAFVTSYLSPSEGSEIGVTMVELLPGDKVEFRAVKPSIHFILKSSALLRTGDIEPLLAENTMVEMPAGTEYTYENPGSNWLGILRITIDPTETA